MIAGAPGRMPGAARAGVAALASVVLGAGPAAADLPDTVARIKPSIVAVGTHQVTRRPPSVFRGTGFLVGDGRHAITNAHVIPDEVNAAKGEHLAVFRGAADRPEVRRAEVRARDLVHDLALLRVDGPPGPALAVGDGARVREGERYAFTGFPVGMVLGLRPVTHRGIVSAITPVAVPQISPGGLTVRMIRTLRNPYDVFQLDATAYPGNSGSPLYDPETGEVVGVINKVFVKETKENLLRDPSAITYAIPARHVRALLREAGLE